MALLVVLVLIMMASFIAYGYMFSMENQYRDARMYEEQMQAQHAALSGLELVTALVELSSERRQGIGNLHDNADIFRDCALDSNPASSRSVSVDSWRFSIISPRPINPQSPATGSATASSTLELQRDDSLSVLKFGLENQTAKLSLSALASWDRRTPGHAKQVLMSLPGATLEVVEALMERSGIQSPSRKPQSMQSVTANQTRSNDVADPILQLHLLWMGGDLNCNYRLGPFDLAWSQDNSSNSSDRSLGAADLYRSTNRTAGPTSQGPTNSLGSQSRPDENPDNEANYAWRQLLSWEGGFRNENQEGTPRINLNEPNLQKLHQELMQRWPIEWANYVITYR